ncbi:hypothetical protein SAMN05444156_1928 [Verrucomicrobium sp. GAS474]|uniref:hypothetical protein n=1 Tax=Verrucomicrobium sp. GAS474 TaxID=1882831 RepID=UPI00087A5ABB|nr:hypothetical protein [Verrucomicrobium sp. GAS474]SDU09553.1 hypothetical protein SAMN05444156_1928 [Verrucomicrobium sp. GAS474]
MGEPPLSRNVFPAILRAVFGVAVLWTAMHFFFAWQDGRLSVVMAKIMPAVTTTSR